MEGQLFLLVLTTTPSTSVVVIVRPHRNTTYVDAVYCYRLSSVVCLSVGVSVCQLVCHTSEPCKND